MEEPLEDLYFKWLCAKVMSIENPTPSLTYWKLLTDLHNFEFVWLLSGDDNRAEDGVDLRQEFLNGACLESDPNWHALGCSVFEMLFAFSRRAAFETDRSAKEWFWIFIENLSLLEFNDANYLPNVAVSDILYRFVWRTYNFNGRGGLFPLQNPRHDQRKIEVWYQFCEYLVDHDIL